MTYTTYDAQVERYSEPYREPVSEPRPANNVEAIRQRLAEIGKTIASLRESLAGKKLS